MTAEALAGRACHLSGDLQGAVRHYRKAVESAADDVEAWCLLGRALLELGRPEMAVQALGEARRHNPLRAEIQAAYLLAQAIMACGGSPQAMVEVARGLRSRHRYDDALWVLELAQQGGRESVAGAIESGTVYRLSGQINQARECFERALAMDPGNVEAQYWAGILGKAGAARMPAGVARALFDGYADTFDEHLRGGLRYTLPERLREALVEAAGPDGGWRVLDLGCGTGLMGVCLRDLAAWLAGIDLSPRMIEKARETGVYDELLCADLTEAPPEAGRWDVVTAADVFIYLGDLQAVFVRCAEALRPGGLLVFSCEHRRGKGYRAEATGRFRHAPEYVEGVAGNLGFERVARHRIHCRMEDGKPVAGDLYVLRRG